MFCNQSAAFAESRERKYVKLTSWTNVDSLAFRWGTLEATVHLSNLQILLGLTIVLQQLCLWERSVVYIDIRKGQGL
jgi:hypothetical protein